MKRIVSILMAVCMLVCMAAPAMAQAADLTDAAIQLLDSGEPEDTPTIGDSGDVSNNEAPQPATPADAEETTPDISLFSDFGDGDATFTTKIRLTVTDRDGNPLVDVVYGLYQSDGTFVQEIVTDEFGVALSDDIPVNTDYYLEEISAPEGFQPNTERKEIILTDVCAPSRIDVTAEYDPIMGRIKVIKTDEDGNRLSGMGFYVYCTSDYWTQVDNITVGEDGTATTIELPYGDYALEEYNIPDGLAADSDYYVSIYEHDVTVEVEIVNYPAQGDMKITKTGNDGRKIAGAVFEIHNANTDELTQTVTTNSSGYVWSAYMPLGNYYAVETSVPAPYALDTTRHEFSLTYNNQSIYLNIENEVDGEPGRVKVIKTDDSENPLSGVGFDLFRAWDSKKLSTLTTGTDGTAESGDLIPGDYYLVETTGKPGYTMEAGQIPFTIGGDGAVVEKTVVNPKIRIFGKVQVVKQDDAGNPIPGVRFGVYCDEDNLLEEITTGEDGTATSGVLNEGNYYLLELAGVDGYQMDTEPHPFSITENETVVPVTVTNPRISGAVKVLKTGTEGEPLSGVKFDVFRAATAEKAGELVTDETGAASLTLPLGRYYLVETETAEGYKLLSGQLSFILTADGETVTLPIANQRDTCKVEGGHIRLTKKDVDTGAVLSGAAFGIYRVSDNEKVGEITTGSDGTAMSLLLPVTDYYLLELRAPADYEITAEKFPATVTDGGMVELTVTNKRLPEPEPEPKPEPQTGTVKIIKVDADDKGKTLSGAVFSVYETATGKKVGELLTGKDGTASLELPEGDFTLRETTAPEGYTLSTESISVHLKAGETRELNITNHKDATEPGTLRVVKVDKNGGKKLKNAIFGVYDADSDKKLDEITTDRKGVAELELPAGDYYLRELEAPDGYERSEKRINFSISAGKTTEKTVKNVKEDSDEDTGTLVIIKEDKDTGDGLKNAVFGIYDSDGDKIDEVETGRDGTAELDLDTGSYYLRELSAPEGYRKDGKKVTFRITTDKTTKVTVKNEKEPEDEKTGTLRLVKSAAGTGARLSGASFAVYAVDGDKKVADLITGADGVAELSLEPGSYYLKEQRAPEGFKLETARILFTITADTKTNVEVTNEKAGAPTTTPTTPVPSTPENPGTPNDTPQVTIPKTGEAFPTLQYALAALLLAASTLCGVTLYRGRRRLS